MTEITGRRAPQQASSRGRYIPAVHFEKPVYRDQTGPLAEATERRADAAKDRTDRAKLTPLRAAGGGVERGTTRRGYQSQRKHAIMRHD